MTNILAGLILICLLTTVIILTIKWLLSFESIEIIYLKVMASN